MRQFIKEFDLFYFFPIILIGFGILAIYSGNRELAVQQLIFASIGLSIFFIISQIDYRIYKNFLWHLYFLSLLFLIIIIFVGTEIRGAIRWIDLGFFRIQPSELIKPLIIIVFASFADRYNLSKIGNFILYFILLIPIVILISRQPDLGNAIIFIGFWFTIGFAAGARFLYLVSFGVIFAIAIPFIWQFLAAYQKERIIAFVDPTLDPLGTGYNVLQSTIAIGSGKVFGRGLGQGTQSHLQFLPEHSTDFIFASLAEELGFIGAFILLVVFFLLIIHGFKIALGSKYRFGALLVIGVISALLIQGMVNIGMNMGLLPVAGVTLPLISYGGSSLISTLIGLGIVASINKLSKTAYG